MKNILNIVCFFFSGVKIPVSLRMILFCQIKGSTKIKMTPVSECDEFCTVKKFTLKQGQTRKNLKFFLAYI